jgi:hypothetical protein
MAVMGAFRRLIGCFGPHRLSGQGSSAASVLKGIRAAISRLQLAVAFSASRKLIMDMFKIDRKLMKMKDYT